MFRHIIGCGTPLLVSFTPLCDPLEDYPECDFPSCCYYIICRDTYTSFLPFPQRVARLFAHRFPIDKRILTLTATLPPAPAFWRACLGHTNGRCSWIVAPTSRIQLRTWGQRGPPPSLPDVHPASAFIPPRVLSSFFSIGLLENNFVLLPSPPLFPLLVNPAIASLVAIATLTPRIGP